MEKHFFTLIFLILIISSLHGQQKIEIDGNVIDAENGNEIKHASISLKNNSVGTISNNEGGFHLIFNGSKNDTIYFSHVQYDKEKIPVNKLLNEDSTQIRLTRKNFELDEIVLKARSISEIIESAINNSNDRIKKKLPYFFQTYYREFVKEDEQHTKFADGILDYFIYEKTNKVKTIVRVNQSRAKDIKVISDDEIDWDIISPLDVQKFNLFKIIGQLKNIFEKKKLHYYDFKLLSNISDDGSETLLVNFKPKFNIKQTLYSGSIEIDKKQNLILSFEYKLSPKHTEYSKEINFLFIRGKTINSSIKVIFNLIEDNYNIHYAKRQVGIRIWNKKKIDKKLFFLSDLLVNEIFEKPSQNPILKKEIHKEKALYSLGDNYESYYWNNKNVILLDIEEEKILKQFK